MLVGVDFDNTIVCYDRLFHALAVERALIPAELPANKAAVRDYLRSIGREDDWTELQGVAYGPEIGRAEPFPGVLEFFRECKRRGVPTAIVSHKTRHPYRGEKHDLHAAARSFLRQHGFLDESVTGLSLVNVFLELTKEEKLGRIGSLGCTHFVDDLPEFLGEAAFPGGVERILFDPERRYPADPRLRRMSSWAEIAASMLGSSATPAVADVAKLLTAARVPDDGFHLTPISGSGNNRGYRLTTSDGKAYFLKWYFRHPDDLRDRLGTEFAFTQFCRRHGVDEVPEPLAREDAAGLALYEFIDGRRLTSDEIDEAAVDAATEFFRHVNQHRLDVDAAILPIASEACFSVEEHLDRIGGRVDRLVAATGAVDADVDFKSFVEQHLAPSWKRLREQVLTSYEQHRESPSRLLVPEERRLSPSDFGFHNALLTPEGRLRFIDLEYAGWDDPAKTFCDFFCQLQVPVPKRFAEPFRQALGRDVPYVDFPHRCLQLLPAYRVKWCCIALNVFLPSGSARRAFGTAQPATSERRAEQLRKAVEILSRTSL